MIIFSNSSNGLEKVTCSIALLYICVTPGSLYVMRIFLKGTQCVGDIPKTCSEAIKIFIYSHKMNNTHN